MRTPITLQNRKVSLVIIHKNRVEVYDNKEGYSQYKLDCHYMYEADKYLNNGWHNVVSKEYEV